MLRLLPPMLPLRLELSLDWRVLAFGLALALGSGVLFGLAPALRTTTAGALDSARGSTVGRATSRLRSALVVTQVAVSLILLVSGAPAGKSHAGTARRSRFRVAGVAARMTRRCRASESAGRVLNNGYQRVTTSGVNASALPSAGGSGIVSKRRFR
jgi:hypothetical protein